MCPIKKISLLSEKKKKRMAMRNYISAPTGPMEK